MTAFSPAFLVCSFALINLWAFMLFGIDKLRAEAGSRRIREDTLLTLALLGGSIGAYAGRAIFRHKTRKQPFSARLHMIALVQVVALPFAAGYLMA